MTEETDYLAHLESLWARAWPADRPREPVYPFGEVALGDYLARWAEVQPDKPAVIFYGAVTTYAELDEASDRFAALLTAHGVRPGDPVCVFMQNCPQYHVVFLGILKAGAIHAPVSPMSRALELSYQLQDTGATVIVALDQLMPIVRQAEREAVATVFVTALSDALPAVPTIPVPDTVAAAKIPCDDAIDLLPALRAVTTPPPPPATDLDAVAALNYTSGTTGMPKGCVHTQRDMIYTAATGAVIGFGLTQEDVTLNFVPEFWIAGEDLALIFPLFCGSTLVLMARWDAEGFMAAVDRYQVTKAYALVDSIVEVMEHPSVRDYDLRSLQGLYVSSFVKKLSVAYRQQWRALTGGTLIEAAFGMTETQTFDTFTAGQQADDADLKSRPIFVGLPMPGTQFKVCDFETGALLPLGEEGEICIRSPSLLKGYWRRPDASAAALRDGWLRTGDNGVVDEQGFLHYLGRRKEMLKVNGMSVFPAEIEALLGQHPDVIGSGVIGVPHPERGEQPVAFIRLRVEANDVTEEALTAWCRKNMSGFKVPRIIIVDALPLTATGKVKKNELAALLTS
ncbi:AMP-binding protein [Rhodopila sp.]|uniref:AMP-binding protein n=1 Tax=Rhodopila sp. TaxID=2480087 RepID=UPI002C0FB0BA|nr:AMP-binding protein [Rhodopila sp.]HVZ10402.1 AMP-binding protein [Rhodopila sp.]